MPNDSSTSMKRLDHHCSPIAPRLLRALMPPSARRGRDGSYQRPESKLLTAPPASLGHRRRRQRDHIAQFRYGELRKPALAGADNPLRERFLLLDHGVDPFLERAYADELAHLHVLALPDPESPVGRLVFHGGVPPAVDVDHMAGGRQVQPGAARLQGEQEHRWFRYVLKLRNQGITLLLRRAAMQVENRAAEAARQVRLQHPAEFRVLREAQRLVALGNHLVADLLEPGQLPGPAVQPGAVTQ